MFCLLSSLLSFIPISLFSSSLLFYLFKFFSPYFRHLYLPHHPSAPPPPLFLPFSTIILPSPPQWSLSICLLEMMSIYDPISLRGKSPPSPSRYCQGLPCLFGILRSSLCITWLAWNSLGTITELTIFLLSESRDYSKHKPHIQPVPFVPTAYLYIFQEKLSNWSDNTQAAACTVSTLSHSTQLDLNIFPNHLLGYKAMSRLVVGRQTLADIFNPDAWLASTYCLLTASQNCLHAKWVQVFPWEAYSPMGKHKL